MVLKMLFFRISPFHLSDRIVFFAQSITCLLLELHLERVVIGLPLIQCDVAPRCLRLVAGGVQSLDL